MGVTGFLSMWLANIPTTAMMIPIAAAVLTALNDHRMLVRELRRKKRCKLVAWRSGNAFHPINEVTLRRAGLVLRWVTACGQVNHLGM